MGIPFHETVRGAKFFDSDMPRLIKAVERLAAAEEAVVRREDREHKIPYERLEQICCAYIDNDIEGASEMSYIRDILTDVCGMTKEEINQLGFGYLFPESD